tara:strand:+ start:583 stop:759 length:177 start_codon:yes stop_codon:yes gene_type:complete
MTTGSVPGTPGFSSKANAKGPTAGFDPVMDKKVEKRKRKPTPIGRYRTRVTWMKKGES